MHFSKVRLFTGALAFLAMASAPMAAQDSDHPATKPQSDPAMNAQEKKNLQFMLDWWREVIVARHVDLAEKYQAEDYIQHNPNIPTGRAAFVKAFGARPPQPIPDKLPTPPVVTFAKGDYVGLIWEREDKDPTDPSQTYRYNTFDVLRIQNGKIQEHWDSAFKNLPQPPGGRQ